MERNMEHILRDKRNRPIYLRGRSVHVSTGRASLISTISDVRLFSVITMHQTLGSYFL